jgi:hypothetical protein
MKEEGKSQHLMVKPSFASWWKKFLAYAMMSKFKDILKETREKT